MRRLNVRTFPHCVVFSALTTLKPKLKLKTYLDNNKKSVLLQTQIIDINKNVPFFQ